MMKSMYVAGFAAAALALVTGCANVTPGCGGPAIGSVGMNIYSETAANCLVPQYAPQNYIVVQRNVKATAKLKSIFTAFNFGDASYETMKAEALKGVPNATDLTDVKIDYKVSCVCGINDVTVTLTGTAIRFK